MARRSFTSPAPADNPRRRNPNRNSDERDPFLGFAREEAEDANMLEGPAPGWARHHEHEEAEGVEVFSDPDATLPIRSVVEGSPGHETLTGDSLGLRDDGEDDRERA